MTTDNAPFRPIIRTQADLELAWRQLMSPLGFGRHSIWMMLVDTDDRPVPQITEIEDADEPPTPEQTETMSGFFGRLVTDVCPGARLAFLRSRPGGGGANADDRAWAQSLYDAARLAGVPIEVVHLATDHDVVAIPLDDLPVAI